MKNRFIFDTSQGRFVLVEIPEIKGNVTEPYVTHIDYGLNTVSIQDLDTGQYVFGVNIPFPVQAIGMVKDLTEEHFAQVVDKTLKGGKLECYMDYWKGYYSHSLYTAFDSFQSLLLTHDDIGCSLYENFVPHPDALDNLDKGTKAYEDQLQTHLHAKNYILHNPMLLKAV